MKNEWIGFRAFTRSTGHAILRALQKQKQTGRPSAQFNNRPWLMDDLPIFQPDVRPNPRHMLMTQEEVEAVFKSTRSMPFIELKLVR